MSTYKSYRTLLPYHNQVNNYTDATFYLILNAIPTVFQEKYGWSVGETGLAYIPMGTGTAIGLWLFAKTSDKAVRMLTAANNDVYEPEFRLMNMGYSACLLPVTFFWFGWSVVDRVHWSCPLIGLVPYGVGIIGVFQPSQAYVIDAFGSAYCASALAAFAVLRSVVVAFLPIVGAPLYAKLGLGWGCSVLGFISVAMVPIPILIERYGKWLRQRFAREW